MRLMIAIIVLGALFMQGGCAGVLLGGGGRDVSTADATTSNEALINRVQRELRQTLGEQNVNVTAYQGRVILRGQVGNPASIAQAERVAGAVSGVVSVDNRLTTR